MHSIVSGYGRGRLRHIGALVKVWKRPCFGLKFLGQKCLDLISKLKDKLTAKKLNGRLGEVS